MQLGEGLKRVPWSVVVAATAQAHASIAFRAIGLAGVCRADFIVDESGTPWFLEINTIPGMTETSLLPKAAMAAGYDFQCLCERIAELSMAFRKR